MRRAGLLALPASLLGAAACSAETPDTYSREQLLKPTTCGECHHEYYDEWSGSMHAYASKDPVFRAMNERGQKDAALGDFCIKCHAPMAVAEARTKDGLNLDQLPDELQGVTCYYCHQVSAVHGANNAQLDLAEDETMRAGIGDPVRNKAHRSAYSPLHDGNSPDSSSLCGSCHDIVVPAHFSGAAADVELERTFAEWKDSIFSKAKPAATCNTCHFSTGDESGPVTIADYPGVPTTRRRHHHDFPGVDVALTPFPNKDGQQKAVTDMLVRAVAVTVCVSQTFGARVILENRGAGHGVPSGAAQDRRMWVELVATSPSPSDPTQQLVFSSGAVPAGTSVVGFVDADGSSPTIFRDETFDAAGNPAHFFWEIARADRHALNAPRTNSPTDPLFHKVGDLAALPGPSTSYRLPGFIYERLTVKATVRVQPIGLDVLDELYAAAPQEGAAVRAAMPTLAILPNASSDATVEWTFKKALASNNVMGDAYCISSADAPP